MHTLIHKHKYEYTHTLKKRENTNYVVCNIDKSEHLPLVEMNQSQKTK